MPQGRGKHTPAFMPKSTICEDGQEQSLPKGGDTGSPMLERLHWNSSSPRIPLMSDDSYDGWLASTMAQCRGIG